jgi:hypothetical protein
MRLAQLSLIAILQLLACDGLGTASETVATLQPQGERSQVCTHDSERIRAPAPLLPLLALR